MKDEIETIEKMIGIYCRGKHSGADGLCQDCRSLLDYAIMRIGKCPQKPKPKCKDCKIHCFNVDKSRQIKEVMRFSGPRMLTRHPLLALKHFLK